MVKTRSDICRTAVAAAMLLASTPARWGHTPLSAASPSAGPPEAQAAAVVQVSSEPELQAAIASLTSDATIVLAPGTYRLTSTLSIKGALTNVAITGATNDPNDVVLVGMGMSNAKYGAVPHGVVVAGNVQGITIANLTIRDVYNHAIALEPGADQPRLYNLRLIDAGRQFVKASSDGRGGGVDDGVVEQSIMEYTQDARDADTGAVHVGAGSRWTIRGNHFRNIKAPKGQLARPAILLFQGSRDSIVERNTFVNCQREVALGLEDRTPHDHQGGVVRNNFIVRDFATEGSTAIQVADSPYTQVVHNTILSNTASTSLIDYRFSDTTGVVIRNNLLDGRITAREGASGTASDNYLGAVPAMFVAAASGDLHLNAAAVEVIDQAGALLEVPGDIDGEGRPQGVGADYGADEYVGAPAQTPVSKQAPTSSTSVRTAAAAASNGSGATSVEAEEPAANGLPAPWRWADVGAVQKPGSVSWSSDAFSVQAAGNDIGGNADQFTFVYQTLEGDGEILARVSDLVKTHPWAKAGVMIRDELSGGAKYASALVTAEKGLVFQYRIAAGASTSQMPAGQGRTPQWVRLVRRGHKFTAFASADGTTWTTLGSESVYLNQLVYVGMAVTSRSARTLTTARFTDVTVAATSADTNQPPQVSITSPTPGTTYDTPSIIEITAAASDPDGHVSKVEFYAGTGLIGSVTSSPYRVAWGSVAPGKHMLSAVVHDDRGAKATSPAVEVTVADNQLPSVSLTTPASGASFPAPGRIDLAAAATDPDGTIARVDFFAGSTQIGSATTAPYTMTWMNVAAGSYTLTAVARDNTGATGTSAPVVIAVTTPTNQPPLVALTSPANGSSFGLGAAISLAATAEDGDGAIAKVEFYAGSTLVGSDTSSPYTAKWEGASAGTYTVSAKAWDNMGASSISAGINVTVDTVPALPSPWQTLDIGVPEVAGSASYSAGAFTVSGAGAEIGGLSDQFRFVYQRMDGDGEVVACVTSLDFVDAWTSAGVMIRESRTPSSAFAFSLLSSGWGAAFHHRSAVDQPASQSDPVAGVAPHCVRLVRQGSTFTAYQSMDGATWVVMGSTTIPMRRSVFAGLVVASHKVTAAATAVFDRVVAKEMKGNGAPAVSITSPSPGTSFMAPATVMVTASASDPDGNVAAVDFYAGAKLIGSDSSSPYGVTWNEAAAGSYSLTAVARDDSGASTASAPVAVTVAAPGDNQPPVVSITAPSTGATFAAPINLIVSATASDADGSVSRVDFYAGTSLVGSDSTSPFSATWNSAPIGTHSLTAVAIDNSGASTSSAPVSVTIKASNAPSVTLTAPVQGASFSAPANITLTASASDSDGTIAAVDFYAGTYLIGSDTTSPYSVVWSNVAPGTYTLKAVARDNSGLKTTSAGVFVSVAGAAAAPGSVVFNASADHTKVKSYTVEIFAAGANPATATPVQALNIGKPTPVNGEITADVSAAVKALASGTYFITVSATDGVVVSRCEPSEIFAR